MLPVAEICRCHVGVGMHILWTWDLVLEVRQGTFQTTSLLSFSPSCLLIPSSPNPSVIAPISLLAHQIQAGAINTDYSTPSYRHRRMGVYTDYYDSPLVDDFCRHLHG